MKRFFAFGLAAAVAAVPAVVGLAGNASFAHSVPVQVPAHVQSIDDRGGQTRTAEPGDDKGGQTRTAEPGDDRGGDSGGHGSDG
jgi:hypothetical protein